MRSDHKLYRQGPKESLTTWSVLSRELVPNDDPEGPSTVRATRLELRPQTGRTHQLRVHCARVLGAPIVGDEIYGPHSWSSSPSRRRNLCLHAQELCICHPISGAPMVFESTPPF